MEDPQLPDGANVLPVQGPHWQHHANIKETGFVPLRLVLQPGGLSVELTKPDVLLGRHSEADIWLRLPDVSRRHCRFVFTEGGWQIHDLNSLNGVYVNDDRVQQAPLQHRDLVQIGSYLFEVDLQPGMPTLQLPAVGPLTAEKILESISDALPVPLPGTTQDSNKKAS